VGGWDVVGCFSTATNGDELKAEGADQPGSSDLVDGTGNPAPGRKRMGVRYLNGDHLRSSGRKKERLQGNRGVGSEWVNAGSVTSHSRQTKKKQGKKGFVMRTGGGFSQIASGNVLFLWRNGIGELGRGVGGPDVTEGGKEEGARTMKKKRGEGLKKGNDLQAPDGRGRIKRGARVAAITNLA